MRKKTIDVDKCTGCKNCEIACIVVHSPNQDLQQAYKDGGIAAIRSRCKTALSDDGRYFPQHCRHCEDPQCVRACMSGALSRGEDGYVLCDTDICVGCYMCVMSCPNGVARPSTGANRIMLKCDGCVDEECMACVENCPTGCLSVTETSLAGDIVEYINQPDAREGDV